MKLSRLHLCFVLVVAWLIGTGTAFWSLEGQYFRPAHRPAGAAESRPDLRPPVPIASLPTDQGRIRLAGPGPVTLLNFWNPNCPCSRFSEVHTAQLARTFGPRGVRCVTVIECAGSPRDGLSAWKSRGLSGFAAAADPGGETARTFGVWAAPAAVVLDREGRVCYVGAYNSARYCDDSHSAWAQQALEAVLAGRRPPRAKTLFFGCQVIAQR